MRAKHPDVVAVTVTYGDRFDLLARVAEPVLASPGIVRWVVVTNGVHARVAQKIAALDARVTLRSFATNTGSAPAYADGIATALETGADFVWLLDDDNLPDADALARLLEAQASLSRNDSEPWRTAVCARRPDKPAQYAEGASRRMPSSFLGFHARQWLGRHALRSRASAASCTSAALTSAPYGGLLLPVRLLRETGLPDPQFVLYADDTEFTDRIVRRGGRIQLVAAAHVADISPSWQGRDRLRDAWLDEASEARVFYGARNEAWFDFHRLMANRWLYRFHRSIVVAAWWCASRREPRRKRFTLLVEAIHAGEAGRLGVDARFPLDTAADAE